MKYTKYTTHDEDRHKATIVQIGGSVVHVDIGIEPLVDWLNSFTSVYTHSSCEGDTKKDNNGDMYLPYVSFKCNNNADLRQILVIVDKICDEQFSTCIEFDITVGLDCDDKIIYCINFYSPQSVNKFIKEIEK